MSPRLFREGQLFSLTQERLFFFSQLTRFHNTVFLLRCVLEERDKLFEDIAAHSQLKQIINCIIEAPPEEEGLRTQVDLGSNFYVQAHV